jgi:hypothetical protein
VLYLVFCTQCIHLPASRNRHAALSADPLNVDVGAVILWTRSSLKLTRVMPLTAAQVRAAITSNPWTKDFRHLEAFPTSYLKRYSFKDMLVKAVKPQDRIKYWNIVPGDRVRIAGDKGGQVLEVAKINRLSNRVYLKGSSASVRRCLSSALPSH